MTKMLKKVHSDVEETCTRIQKSSVLLLEFWWPFFKFLTISQFCCHSYELNTPKYRRRINRHVSWRTVGESAQIADKREGNY